MIQQFHFLGRQPKELKIGTQTHPCTQMILVALLTTTKMQTESIILSTMNGYTKCSISELLDIKVNDIMIHTTWMNFEDILSDINQAQKG